MLKRRQKIMSLFLAAALTVSSAVLAFAENMQDILSSGDVPEISSYIEERASGFSVSKEFEKDSRLVSVCLEWPEENKSYRWEADTRQWSCVNGSFEASGVYVLGEAEDFTPLSWRLDVSGNTAEAVPGYRWNADSQTYEYYLDEADVSEMEGVFKDVPSILYVGAKGDISKHSGLQIIDGETYYLNDDGSLLKNAEKNVDGTTYCFDENGTLTNSYQPVTPGWVKKSGKYYWQLENGSFLQEGGWHILNGKKYFLDEELGFRRTGWLDWNGSRYYLLKNGVMKTGLLKLNHKCYVLNTKGRMIKKGWAVIGSRTYYIDPKTGCTVSGWRTIGGKRYYFIESANGRRAGGWRKIDNAKYYFNPKTGVMKKGLLKLSGKLYYLGKNGKLVTNKKIFAVGGKYYRIKKNGVLIKLNDSKALILAKLRLEQIGWNLKNAFDWSAGIDYVDNSNNPSAGYTFEEYNAIYGFKNHAGNSQVMASTFYYMAQALGYPVHMMRGYIPLAAGGMRPHAWCEITLNKKVYLFDPNFTNETGKNGYRITYDSSEIWQYTGAYRIN